MWIFVAIAVAAFILVTGSFLFGGNHGTDHDHGDAGHGVEVGGAEPTISIFSTKVMGTWLMGFGAAGAIASAYGLNHLAASLIGLGCGLVLGALMYFLLGVFYRQQASSLVATPAAVGCMGTVTVTIEAQSLGEVGLTVEGQYLTYSARSNDGSPIAKGQLVRVVRTMGSQLVVEKAG